VLPSRDALQSQSPGRPALSGTAWRLARTAWHSIHHRRCTHQTQAPLPDAWLLTVMVTNCVCSCRKGLNERVLVRSHPSVDRVVGAAPPRVRLHVAPAAQGPAGPGRALAGTGRGGPGSAWARRRHRDRARQPPRRPAATLGSTRRGERVYADALWVGSRIQPPKPTCARTWARSPSRATTSRRREPVWTASEALTEAAGARAIHNEIAIRL
jgi:hypothetical protein